MVESAAHLIDQVLREQPIRQWLLIFPYRLRFLFAAQPQVPSGVLGVVYRAISTCLVRKSGFTVASGAKTGAITLIQRFCSASSMMRPVNARSTARSSDTWRSAGRSNAGQKGPDNICDMYSRAATSAPSSQNLRVGAWDFWFLARRDDAAWQAPCKEEQRSQGPKRPANTRRFWLDGALVAAGHSIQTVGHRRRGWQSTTP